LRDPGLFVATVAHALDLSDSSGGPQAARLLDSLRHKRLLLVLDNFEHILTATARVAEWLSASVHLQVLVTSRTALNLRGERLFPLSTLPVPPNASVRSVKQSGKPDLAQLDAYPSVSLFVERVQAVDPFFRLTTSNSHAVAQLCARMEGLPLAIELTAARSARLAPELVLARLERRLDVMTTGPRDLPHHQQTLRTAIEWSYDLLAQPERLLFARMSVFAGGATLDALEAVCNAHEDLEGGVAGPLEGLLQQSLVHSVTIEGEEDVHARRRFNMLEMLREYAGERLDEGEPATHFSLHEHNTNYAQSSLLVKRYHAEYYMSMAQAAELQISTAEQGVWLDRLERDHDNLRVAIQWALESGQTEMAGGLCAALWNFWKTRGYVSEGRNWLQRVLAHEADLSPLHLANVLNGAGVLARSQGDYQLAGSLLERSLTIFRELGDKRGTAKTLNNLAVNMQYLSRVDEAEPLYAECLELWRELGDKAGMAKPLNNLGLIALSRDDDVRAAELFRESLRLARVNKDKGGMSMSSYNLGIALASLWGPEPDKAKYWEEAERCFTESITLARELGDKGMLGLCLIKFGELSLNAGDEASLTQATTLLEDGLSLKRELGDREAIAYTLNHLGFADLLRGDLAKAWSRFEEGLEIARTLGSKSKIAMSLQSIAMALAATAAGMGSSQDFPTADTLPSHASALGLNTGPRRGRASEPATPKNQSLARRAVQLYSASTALSDPYLLPARDRFYRATFDAVHTLLSQDEFEALEAAGHAMSIDEAISFALDSRP
jgi:predicted ATPase